MNAPSYEIARLGIQVRLARVLAFRLKGVGKCDGTSFIARCTIVVAESSRFQETVGKQILEKRAIEFEITYGDRGFR